MLVIVQEAEDTQENYFVLVVAGDADLKQKLLVDYANYTSTEKCERKKIIEDCSYLVEGICERLIKAPMPEEVEPDINGYWIKSTFWSKGEKINEWISNKDL